MSPSKRVVILLPGCWLQAQPSSRKGQSPATQEGNCRAAINIESFIPVFASELPNLIKRRSPPPFGTFIGPQVTCESRGRGVKGSWVIIWAMWPLSSECIKPDLSGFPLQTGSLPLEGLRRKNQADDVFVTSRLCKHSTSQEFGHPPQEKGLKSHSTYIFFVL